MSALFDTNIVIDILDAYPPALIEAGLYPHASISRITWMEVLIGAPDSATQQKWESFLSQFQILEISELVCRDAIAIRIQQRIKLPDAIILASARLSGSVLVTRNSRDFRPDTPGIRIPYKR